jgi:hypothetical protein
MLIRHDAYNWSQYHLLYLEGKSAFEILSIVRNTFPKATNLNDDPQLYSYKNHWNIIQHQ